MGRVLLEINRGWGRGGAELRNLLEEKLPKVSNTGLLKGAQELTGIRKGRHDTGCSKRLFFLFVSFPSLFFFVQKNDGRKQVAASNRLTVRARVISHCPFSSLFSPLQSLHIFGRPFAASSCRIINRDTTPRNLHLSAFKRFEFS